MTSIPLLCMPVTRPARRNACGAFSCPTPCAPALEGTPISPILSNIVHLNFPFHSYQSLTTRGAHCVFVLSRALLLVLLLLQRDQSGEKIQRVNRYSLYLLLLRGKATWKAWDQGLLYP